MEPSVSPKPQVSSDVDIEARPGWWGWLKSKSVASGLLALLFFVVLTGLILWPLSAHLSTSANNEGDDLQQIWSMGWVMHSLTHDPANLFNANIFYPYPNTLAYSDHLIPQALMGLPIYLLTNNLVLSYNLVMFATFVLAGWGMFWLVRDITQSAAAGLLAGTIFAFAPYKIAHLSQLNLLSIQWLPFAFLCLRRAVLTDVDVVKISPPKTFWQRLRGDWGWLLGFGLFFVLQSLSSTYYFLYALPLYALYLAGLYLCERRWPSLFFLTKLVAVGVLAFLIMLPTLLPYLQVSESQAAERTTREVAEFSANYRFYLGVPDNNLLWGGSLAKWGGSGGERRLFPGALAYLFALIALLGPFGVFVFYKSRKFRGRNSKTSFVAFAGIEVQKERQNFDSQTLAQKRANREKYLFLVLGVFAVLMSFGFTLHLKGIDIPLPYRLFYDYFPGWKGLRAAVRYGVFGLFAVSVLAGLGLAWLEKIFKPAITKRTLEEKPRQRFPLARILPPILVSLLLLATFWEYRSDISYTRPAVLSEPPTVYSWLAEAVRAGPVLELPMVAGPDFPSIHDFYSTLNWQPTINGESGYTPPVYGDLYAATQPDRILSAQTLAALQGIGVRWLVWHLNDESMPLDPAVWQKLQPRLDSSPALKLAYATPTDRIYELGSNGWMSQLGDLLPSNAGLIVSDFRSQQPLLVELTETILQRKGHALYGNDRAGYRFLKPPPTGQPLQYGLFAANEDPTPYGFSQDEAVWSNAWLKLYKHASTLLVSYDLNRDPALAGYNQLGGLKDGLSLSLEQNKTKFNGQDVGGGSDWNGTAQLKLTFGASSAQTLNLVTPDGKQQTLSLAPGLTEWQSGSLMAGATLKLMPANGQSLFLNRVDLVAYQPSNSVTTNSNSEAAILHSETKQEGNTFVSTFEVFAPGLNSATPAHYNFTLDVYKRPWGSANSGHFGTWTVALTGQDKPQTVEFRFDPTSHQATVTIGGQRADIGAQPLDTRDGLYSAYISLNQLDAKNVTQFGVAHLYDFSLNAGQLSEISLLPSRELVFVPPLK